MGALHYEDGSFFMRCALRQTEKSNAFGVTL